MGKTEQGFPEMGRMHKRDWVKILQLCLLAVAPFAITSPAKASDEPISPERTTVILATGDVMLGRNVNRRITEVDDPTWPFQATKEKLESADISIVNLELPLLDPCPQKEGIIFCAPTTNAQGLAQVGIDVANIANNHRYDYGESGYQSTLTVLERLGIQPSDEEHMAIINHNGVTFGFIGFNLIRQSEQMKIPSKAEMLAKVKASKSQVDVLVVSMHWGNEYQAQPAPIIVEYAHSIIDGGADLIIGNHPHVVQPGEIYNGKYIAYSLGNFVFDQAPAVTKKGQVNEFTYQGTRLTQVKIFPISIEDGGQPRLLRD